MNVRVLACFSGNQISDGGGGKKGPTSDPDWGVSMRPLEGKSVSASRAKQDSAHQREGRKKRVVRHFTQVLLNWLRSPGRSGEKKLTDREGKGCFPRLLAVKSRKAKDRVLRGGRGGMLKDREYSFRAGDLTHRTIFSGTVRIPAKKKKRGRTVRGGEFGEEASPPFVPLSADLPRTEEYSAKGEKKGTTLRGKE